MKQPTIWVGLFLLAAGLSCSSNSDPPPMHGGGGDDDAHVGDDDAGTDDDISADDDDDGTPATPDFPDFVTSNADYFVTRIGAVPTLDEATYRLSISGLIDQEVELTLDDLRMLPATEVLNTLECIGNPSTGNLIGTALWEGFSLYDLLLSLGIGYGATHARFNCADGYWSSISLDQIEAEGVIGALRMNGEELPAVQGYPLRVLLPGYYGVKHPAWVTEIELISGSIDDYYETVGWDCSPPMPVDSKFFFPAYGSEVVAGVPIEVGGAAFGGTRVDKVEVTPDGGATWVEAEVVRQDDLDHVWLFWKATVTLESTGQGEIRARATDTQGRTQPEVDSDLSDGMESWPRLVLEVVD